jgi:hypothetical protein
MSKLLKLIARDKPNYHLHISSFYGGKKRGKCIQLAEGMRYVSLNEKELQHLIKAAKEAGFNLI